MTERKKKYNLRSRLVVFLLVLLFFGGASLFSGGRSYGRVPNYDLLVRDVSAGDVRIRIPRMEAFPEGEYYHMVSYHRGLLPGNAEGYYIHPKAEDGTAGTGYSVQCHPEDEYDLTPNTTILDVPVYLGETAPDKIKDGFWVKQFIFELDGYTYWVRFESRNGVVEDVQPVLERLAADLIQI